jgi:large conductance mechanosensitive channel
MEIGIFNCEHGNRYLQLRAWKHDTPGIRKCGIFRIPAEAYWVTGKSARPPPPNSPNSIGVTHVKGFRQFITRGNLIDLAVAVVIGTAFTAVVTAIVADLITPLIAAVGGKRDFSALTFTVNHSTFKYGSLVNAVLSFLIIAAVVYFLIVSPMARVMARINRNKEATERECPECLSTIPIAASRCKFCTAEVPPAPSSRPSGDHRRPR